MPNLCLKLKIHSNEYEFISKRHKRQDKKNLIQIGL